jgi:hypothetical protein
MSTTPRPILGSEMVLPNEPTGAPSVRTQTSPEQPLAKGLASWDLLPSDLILIRRRPVKK